MSNPTVVNTLSENDKISDVHLLPPEKIWAGSTKHPTYSYNVPVRAVRRWHGKTPTFDIIVELASGKDAMGEPRWETCQLSQLPPAFWIETFPPPSGRLP